MRLFMVVFVSALALSAAAPQAQEKPMQPAPKVAAKASQKAGDAAKPAGVPADAVQDAAGDYRYSDPQGKKWIYRRTPFGMTRLEDSPERAAGPVGGAGMKAAEDGDKVRFERPSPFGVWRWEKKKSELDEAEKAALQDSQANNSTASKQD